MFNTKLFFKVFSNISFCRYFTKENCHRVIHKKGISNEGTFANRLSKEILSAIDKYTEVLKLIYKMKSINISEEEKGLLAKKVLKARLGYSICSKLVSYDHTPLLETNRDCNNLWDFINILNESMFSDTKYKGCKYVIKSKDRDGNLIEKDMTTQCLRGINSAIRVKQALFNLGKDFYEDYKSKEEEYTKAS